MKGKMKPLFWIVITLVIFFACLGLCFKTAFGEESIDWDRLVNAVIQVESGGNPDVINKSSGAVGLMQITKPVLDEYVKWKNECEKSPGRRLYKYSVEKWKTWCMTEYSDKYTPIDGHSAPYLIHYDLINKKFNKEVGTWYLHHVHDHYKMKTLEEILCAYNWGVTNVRKKGLKHAPRETREYYARVKKIYEFGEESIDWDRLVNAVIQVESGGNPNAVNKSSGAIGLMQITPVVLKEWNVDNINIACRQNKEMFPVFQRFCFSSADLFDKKTNIMVGSWYLKRLHNYYLKKININGYGTRGKESPNRKSPASLEDYESIHVKINWGEYKPGYENYYEIGYKNWKGKPLFECDGRPMRTTTLELIDYPGFYLGEKWTGKKMDMVNTRVRIALILAAYNGGIGKLTKNQYDINKMPAETKNYVKRVLKIYNRKVF